MALGVVTALHAQTVSVSGWLATFNTFKLSKRTDILFDAQLRSGNQLQQVNTILLRPAINFHLMKMLTVAAGYAFVESRKKTGIVSALVPEQRLWQQVRLQHKAGRASLAHRVRLEERFLPKTYVLGNAMHHKGHAYAMRFRYHIRAIVPFTSTKQFTRGLYAAAQNEVFLNIGNKSAVNGKVFDQNRLYGGVGYRLSRKLDAETGYMNQYQIGPNGAVSNNHIVHISTYLNL